MRPGYASWVRTRLRIAVLIISVCAAACSSSSVDDGRTAEHIPSLTHAVVTMQRSTATNSSQPDQANVLVSVLRVPVTLDSRGVTRLLGLTPAYPDPGQCERVDYARPTTNAIVPLQHVELLDVGDVTLIAGASRSLLVRQAFPTISDFMSGVVYTTRDLSSSMVPPSSAYTVIGRGGTGLPGFVIQTNAPRELSGIAIDGLELGSVTRLTRGGGVDITWVPGDPHDKILVELTSPDRPSTVTCAFDDTTGHGYLTSDVLLSRGTLRVEIHRVRAATPTTANLDRTSVSFDYSVDHLVEVVD
jgi:hypothetical protein